MPRFTPLRGQKLNKIIRDNLRSLATRGVCVHGQAMLLMLASDCSLVRGDYIIRHAQLLLQLHTAGRAVDGSDRGSFWNLRDLQTHKIPSATGVNKPLATNQHDTSQTRACQSSTCTCVSL